MEKHRDNLGHYKETINPDEKLEIRDLDNCVGIALVEDFGEIGFGRHIS